MQSWSYTYGNKINYNKIKQKAGSEPHNKKKTLSVSDPSFGGKEKIEGVPNIHRENTGKMAFHKKVTDNYQS